MTEVLVVAEGVEMEAVAEEAEGAEEVRGMAEVAVEMVPEVAVGMVPEVARGAEEEAGEGEAAEGDRWGVGALAGAGAEAVRVVEVVVGGKGAAEAKGGVGQEG